MRADVSVDGELKQKDILLKRINSSIDGRLVKN